MGWEMEMGWDGIRFDSMRFDSMQWDGMGWDGMGWEGMGRAIIRSTYSRLTIAPHDSADNLLRRGVYSGPRFRTNETSSAACAGLAAEAYYRSKWGWGDAIVESWAGAPRSGVCGLGVVRWGSRSHLSRERSPRPTHPLPGPTAHHALWGSKDEQEQGIRRLGRKDPRVGRGNGHAPASGPRPSAARVRFQRNAVHGRDRDTGSRSQGRERS